MRSIIVILFILIVYKTQAQNLLDNAGFEELNVCTEYHQPCAPESWFYIKPATNPLVNRRAAPITYFGTQMLLLPIYDLSKKIKSLVYSMLICPIKKGKDYKLSFYLNTSGRKFYNVDIAFLHKEPTYQDVDPYAVIPDIKITADDIKFIAKGWMQVERLFTATQDASFILIGNINSFDQMKYSALDGMNKPGMVYYFVDEILLQPLIPEKPCKMAESNKDKMHQQDRRHTEYVLIDNEPTQPEIIIDTLVLPSVLFKTNSASIEQKFAGLLDSVIVKLSQKNIQSMQIIGHTDNKGKYENNVLLSQNRADAVMQYIQSKLSIQNIGREGKADTVPVADNATDAGRTKNRRVEIIISHFAQN